jgi:hypothetical protein
MDQESQKTGPRPGDLCGYFIRLKVLLPEGVAVTLGKMDQKH